MVETNALYYGDNLRILREYIPDESVDLIYLDPPFNSKATYNILYKEPTGEKSQAQVEAFDDTWHWTIEAERAFQEIVETAPPNVVNLMTALRDAIHTNDMMAYLTMMCIRLLELKRVLKDTGSIYLHCDPTASHYLKLVMDSIFGVRNFRNEIIWHYQTGGASKEHYSKKHDIIFFYTKTDEYSFHSERVKISRTEKSLKRAKNPRGARIESDDIMKLPEDVFEIQALNPMAKERLGYPTQKPEALLEHIIKASSNKGDTVLDPFCGCGTAVAVAQRLNRKWIGIDITHLAIALMKHRLKDTQFKVVGEPADLSGAKELASQSRYQFQWWALSLINARPYGDKKKGADTGIDGYYYFYDGGKPKKSIVSVKSGKVGVKDIRELIQVIDREKASMGFFITLEQPTKPMKDEAAKKGDYVDGFNNKYQMIQILTIEEILDGKNPDTPQKHPNPETPYL
jgi:site-specific DNA-methyltransferase (adenine-specific)